MKAHVEDVSLYSRHLKDAYSNILHSAGTDLVKSVCMYTHTTWRREIKVHDLYSHEIWSVATNPWNGMESKVQNSKWLRL